jgi:transcriptional regulator with XRE-family HTH domain
MSKMGVMIGKRAKKLRQAQGMTLTALAGKAGLSKSYVSDMESGKQDNPSFETILSLSVALGADIADLLSLRRDRMNLDGVKPYCWVYDSPGHFDPQNGGEPTYTDFSDVEKPGYVPLYAGPDISL